ncbi:MAG: 5-formyltetrahydrofolate cyclo-ligase [Streptosporangiales bacterium]|nr:5-formyltetrahydrofolate cyclo-ligase [Streptosporangiales bacterium]
MVHVSEDKRALRRRLVAARRARDPEARAAAGRALREELMSLDRMGIAGTVAAYYSVDCEPETHGLVLALWKHGATVLLPVLLGDDDLDWGAYEGPDSLVPGPRGTYQPAGERLGVDMVRRCDVVIAPALAVDRRGTRLGRGAGSYDRALSRASSAALTVALLYDDEVLDEVPAEPHDRRVRAAATPSGVRWFD